MEAQVWTLIGLLAATLIGTLVHLGGRIDSLRTRIDGRLDVLACEIRAQSGRIDGLSSRMDCLADHIYELAIKLDDHLRRHAG